MLPRSRASGRVPRVKEAIDPERRPPAQLQRGDVIHSEPGAHGAPRDARQLFARAMVAMILPLLGAPGSRCTLFAIGLVSGQGPGRVERRGVIILASQ